jgi:hypothetical protein
MKLAFLSNFALRLFPQVCNDRGLGPRSQKACYDVHLAPKYYTYSDSDIGVNDSGP